MVRPCRRPKGTLGPWEVLSWEGGVEKQMGDRETVAGGRSKGPEEPRSHLGSVGPQERRLRAWGGAGRSEMGPSACRALQEQGEPSTASQRTVSPCTHCPRHPQCPHRTVLSPHGPSLGTGQGPRLERGGKGGGCTGPSLPARPLRPAPRLARGVWKVDSEGTARAARLSPSPLASSDQRVWGGVIRGNWGPSSAGSSRVSACSCPAPWAHVSGSTGPRVLPRTLPHRRVSAVPAAALPLPLPSAPAVSQLSSVWLSVSVAHRNGGRACGLLGRATRLEDVTHQLVSPWAPLRAAERRAAEQLPGLLRPVLVIWGIVLWGMWVCGH